MDRLIVSIRARCRYRRRLVLVRHRLAAAYRATAYCAGGLVLHIDTLHPALDARLVAHDYRTWAYLTAVNPHSCRLSAAENRQRMASLRQRLALSGLYVLAGESVAEAPQVYGYWPPEPSLLALGCSLAQARRLARSFGQNAFLFGRVGGRARLIWLA